MKTWHAGHPSAQFFIAVGLFGLVAVSAAVAAPPAPTYVKQATWQETMLATRATFAAPPQQPLTVKSGVWYATDPLPAKNFSESLFPEKGIDLKAQSPDGKPLWREHGEWKDGQAYDLPGNTTVSTYLFRTLTVDRPMTLNAGLGSDDGIEVWLNGAKVHSKDVPRGVTVDADRVPLELKAGENQLLLKIHNNSGGHGFAFSANPAQSAVGALVWQQLEKDFPIHANWMRQYASGERYLAWFRSADSVELEQEMIGRAIRDLGPDGPSLQGELELLAKTAPPAADRRWLDLFEKVCRFRHRLTELRQLNLTALRLAIEDLSKNGQYPRGPELLQQLTGLETHLTEIEMGLARNDQNVKQQIPGVIEQFRALQRDALLSNPLLNFDKLLLVRRKANNLGLPQNWQGNCALSRDNYDNEIAVLSPVKPQSQLTTFYKPEKGQFVGDVDLHFNADKLLFSMPGSHGRWQIWEIRADGSGLRQVTLGEENDVDNYDPCYLPDGRIMFDSTRCFHGVPCVGGGNTVANLCSMDADGRNIRQLCFDQDHDWCPTVLNNGRILYSRWEYSDSPHYFTRLLFHMNPDGTGQTEYYASNSMWPNSIFYARPIPNHPTQVVAVISGHHGVPRMGELVLFDPAKGRREADGVVQRIPGRGQKVKPVIADGLVEGSWPKFLHPYPLSDKYFLVSCKPTPQSEWGLYLVDTFDNVVLLKEEPGYALFEPVPLRKTPTPPVIPDKVDLTRNDATVYLTDVYLGDGLKDVPRGTVKKLRIYEVHYAYPGMGGHINIGIDGPWDVHRILGTVPVEADGSASFRVPANTPIAVQPLDGEGKALQLMRSWFTAMPGENLSCVGCHETQNSTPPTTRPTLASRRKPAEIAPWYGPARGFSFTRDVQPTLDKFCVCCHSPDKKTLPDLTAKKERGWRGFTPSYIALHPYVRRPGPESDYHLQKPLEFHANTSELIQMLEKGHYNVKLGAEGWDRLVTWIDLNVPDHGTWAEHRGGHSPMEQRRLAMRTKYGNRPEDPEAIPELEQKPITPVVPLPLPERKAVNLACAGWPFDAAEAQRRIKALNLPTEVKIELSERVTLSLALIPAGEFVIGDAAGAVDEYPPSVVKIDKPLYMGVCEVTNAQYAIFDAEHDSAYISMTNKDQSERGYPANHPNQPVVRVTWNEAMAFCRWLSQETGHKCSLPTEAQWEFACRAGTSTPFSYGGLDTDFSKFANLADAALQGMARADSPKWHPRDDRFNDGAMITVDVGRYQPNAFGLRDLHGNAAEWTRTTYRPYPYNSGDGRDDPQTAGTKVVRGGSWYDRPLRSRSSFRMVYQPWQHVYNVGFRVVMEAE